MDLDFLIRRPDNGQNSNGCIFLFHGYGSNKEDLFSLEQYLPKSHTIISLEAPLSLPFGGFSWFNIDYSDVIENNLDKRYKEINDSIKSILDNIDRHVENENLNNMTFLFSDLVKVEVYVGNLDSILVLDLGE